MTAACANAEATLAHAFIHFGGQAPSKAANQKARVVLEIQRAQEFPVSGAAAP